MMNIPAIPTIEPACAFSSSIRERGFCLAGAFTAFSARRFAANPSPDMSWATLKGHFKATVYRWYGVEV